MQYNTAHKESIQSFLLADGFRRDNGDRRKASSASVTRLRSKVEAMPFTVGALSPSVGANGPYSTLPEDNERVSDFDLFDCTKQ